MQLECDKRYPELKEEMSQSEQKRGVVAFLLDTLIDFESLGFDQEDLASHNHHQRVDPVQA
jgi:hypothetical protein